MWSILVLLATFISVYTLSILVLSFKIYRSRWTQTNLGSPFSIDPRVHYPRWVLTGHNWNSIYKVCVLFPPSLSILCIVQLKSPNFVLISLIFIFNIILQSFKEIPPSQLFPGAIPWRSINTEESVNRESNLKDLKPSLWINVNLSGAF